MSLSKENKIFITGHKGMVGSSIYRLFKKKGFKNLITKTKDQLDLTDQKSVENFFENNDVDKLIIAAAKVGGIGANAIYPVEFLLENLQIQNNLLHSCLKYDLDQVIFLGSSCIYPKFSKNPISEDQLLSGKLEGTNQWYAIAKIAGIKLAEALNVQYQIDTRSLMPTNLYGPEDNFNLENGHVIPALINKFHNAITNNLDTIEIWGSGEPLREFLHVDDLASACYFTMDLDREEYDSKLDDSTSHYNVGTGEDIKIKDLVDCLIKVTGFKGQIEYDQNKPDGTPKKLLDVSKMNSLGWKYSISLNDGLKNTYDWYYENFPNVRS
jgi:GDP-L-fucose synthase